MWQALAAGVARWVATHGLAMQDVVLLLPYAQLLAPAQRSFAALGGGNRVCTPCTRWPPAWRRL